MGMLVCLKFLSNHYSKPFISRSNLVHTKACKQPLEGEVVVVEVVVLVPEVNNRQIGNIDLGMHFVALQERQVHFELE